MTRVQRPEQPGDSGDDLRMALSDEELAEVISEAVTSEVVAFTENTLLGKDAIAVSDTERIEHLEHDRRLVDLLASTGFAGKRFDAAFHTLTSRLIKYAHPILGLWVRSGHIFGECLKYRGRVHPDAAATAMSWSETDREEVVVDTIINGVDFFLKYGLRGGKWDHRRGASLTTYFVGACVCCFIKICNNRWKQAQLEEAFIRSAPRSEDDDAEFVDLLELALDTNLGPAELAVLRDEARRLYGLINDASVRDVLALRMAGFTQAAAATKVGLTAKAAERRLHTQRKKLRPPTTTSTEDEGRAR